MANNMKAAFTLTLEDKLSSGLNAIKVGLDKLKTAGNGLTLGKLGHEGADLLRTIGREAVNLTSNLRGIEATAGRAAQAMRQMILPKVHAVQEWGKKTLGPQSRMGAFTAAAEGYSFYKPVEVNAAYQDILRHIAISGGLHGAPVDTEMARLDTLFKTDALKAGQHSEKIAEAYLEMKNAGLSIQTLDKAIGEHTRFATAYRLDPKDAGQLSIALLKNMKLSPEEYTAALGQAGQISKEGLFKVSGYSQYMPSISGQMSTMGMTGPAATLQALSALQIVRRNTGDDSSAATDLRTLLEHIYAPIQERAMRMQGKHVPDDLRAEVQANAGAYKSAFGVDYPAYMKKQEAMGVNPLDAYVNLMKDLMKAPDFTDKMRILGQLTHSEQQGVATTALISNYDDWMKMREEGRTKGAEVFELDFVEAMRGASASLSHFTESTEQLERRLGAGFTPVLTPINAGLDGVLASVKKLDDIVPGLTDATLAVTGGLLALVSTLAAIGFVAPAVSAGFSLLGGIAALPVVAAAAVLGGAGAIQGAQNTPWVDDYGRPLGRPSDGATPDATTSLDTTRPNQPGELHVRISSDPGTKAEVTHASPGIFFTIPNPGPATGQP